MKMKIWKHTSCTLNTFSPFHHTEREALNLTDGDSACHIHQLGDSASSLHSNFGTDVGPQGIVCRSLVNPWFSSASHVWLILCWHLFGLFIGLLHNVFMASVDFCSKHGAHVPFLLMRNMMNALVQYWQQPCVLKHRLTVYMNTTHDINRGKYRNNNRVVA